MRIQNNVVSTFTRFANTVTEPTETGVKYVELTKNRDQEYLTLLSRYSDSISLSPIPRIEKKNF